MESGNFFFEFAKHFLPQVTHGVHTPVQRVRYARSLAAHFLFFLGSPGLILSKNELA